MKFRQEILEIKQINSDQKLVLTLIVDQQIPSMNIGCDLTTQEMATRLGMKYKEMADILWELGELGLINSVVQNRRRETKLTALYKRITKKDKDILKD